MSQTETGGNAFFDVSVSDLLGGYLSLEQQKLQNKMALMEMQSSTQQSALHQPNYDSMQDAVNSGYAAPANTVPGYLGSIPKPLLYGSLAVLGFAVIWKYV